jgi:uncharacterized membrane protein YgaE (UPF0421/DUF939 family)
VRFELRRRPADLLIATRSRSRAKFDERVEDLRANWLTLVLAGLAATVAWLIARELLDHRQAFFAPVAAILTLGLTAGQRGRRAIEIGVGVAVGIAVADLLVIAIGTGAWQVGVVVGLAMAAAILAGGGVLLVNQAAISAVLVVTLQADASGISADRFVDALVGSAVALLANALVPIDPLRLVRREAEPLLHELAVALEEVAMALESHDVEDMQTALRRARGLDERIERLREAVDVGRETTTLAPTRRGARTELEPFALAVTSLDHAVRNTRVLARRSLSALEQDDRVPEPAIAAVRELAAAVRELAVHLVDEARAAELERELTRAAAHATAALDVTGNLSANMITGQVRAIAADLLGAMGVEPREARDVVRGARERTGI